MSVATSLGYNYPMPLGVVLPFLNSTIPNKFLLCDGSTYNKSEYPFLSDVLAGIYGDTADTFNLPNLVSKFISGTSANTDTTTGSSGSGSYSVTLAEPNIPALLLSSSGFSAVSTCDYSVITVTGNITCKNEGGTAGGSLIPYQSTGYASPNYTIGIAGITPTKFVGNATPVTGAYTGGAFPANYQLVYIIKAVP
jgi:microcystin-dependent protein